MQVATAHPSANNGRFRRNLAFFLAVPLTAVALITLALTFIIINYQNQHQGRIFTGVIIWGVDLSQMQPQEAQAALIARFPYPAEKAITLNDPETGQTWSFSPTELGLSFDVATTVNAAYAVGRQGSSQTQLRHMFDSWYYGRYLAPIILFDEGKLENVLVQLAAEIDQAPVNAQLDLNGITATYQAGQSGRSLDLADTRSRLLAPLTDFRQAEIELLIHTTTPALYDSAEAINQIQQSLNDAPVSFYIQTALDEFDLERVVLPQAELGQWQRAEVVTQADGSLQHQLTLDENAVRHWLSQYADGIYREPVNARYYFDDDTRELVLVSPHVNGRELDIVATLAQLQQQIGTPNRSIPFVVREITPTVHSTATAAELGITELISERTTWFYGSSDARKRNIAQAAANFYGIVIAPGEEFSFNKYLGTISEADGYEEGLIIVGGQTIKGVGGGICQVSTTVFQTVFYAGYPVTERWQHGYMLGYYNDGEGPGMDATVFSPIVDFKFINNTPYHLLIENYYNEVEEALTFKFYSTSMGRVVEKSGPVFENIIPAPNIEEDVWQYDPDLEPGTVQQIDWATEGATVTVGRTVYNADGAVILQEDFVSNYIPWANGYMYGPEVNAPDYSLILPDK